MLPCSFIKLPNNLSCIFQENSRGSQIKFAVIESLGILIVRYAKKFISKYYIIFLNILKILFFFQKCQEKNFQCKRCKKSFKEIRTLRLHQKIHSADYPEQCEICQKGFRTKWQVTIILFSLTLSFIRENYDFAPIFYD